MLGLHRLQGRDVGGGAVRPRALEQPGPQSLVLGGVMAMQYLAEALPSFLQRPPHRAVAQRGAVHRGDETGEVAAERARGPGSFAIEIIDALHSLDRAALISKAKVT